MLVKQSQDKLILLPDGKLRHYIKNPDDEDDLFEKHFEKDESPLYYDYPQGQYCMDKVRTTWFDSGEINS